ncbi:protease [Streptomyces spongiicola]|uniref:Protease n=1 Tax=Streptomyces spongiicola TaxID=1690221 RepID=A0A2S1Z845_9ACTN|nr:S8 family serine peptidase [Streptomyces spongiicola]AWK12537.1 protease [Streptomyces spongiicola]GBP99608.1 protease [Streptomyces spongiicola]
MLAVTATALLATGAATSAAATPSPAPAASPATPSAAADTPVERLIVGYKSRAAEAASDSAADKDAQAKGKKAGESLGFDRRLGTGAALLDLGGKLDKGDAADVMDAFRADPDVAYVVPDTRMYATAVSPNDTEYSRQWDLFESTAGMNVPAAWDKATGQGVKVAVIDTGYVAHSDLAANIVSGYDFISDPFISQDGGGRDSNAADPGDWTSAGECGVDEDGQPVPKETSDNSWHGTHVAGTIAAAANNGKGVAGIAYDATIQPVRVLGRCGGMTSDIIDAITWASGGSVQGVPSNPNPADVINMSLGGEGGCDAGTQSAINSAVGRGTTIVVAAGNDNANAAYFNPASCSNVITVAASDRQGNRAYYSNYGSVVDITAPGGETPVSSSNGILSTLNSGTRSVGSESYAAYQGTSMAAPHIAGLAALMIDANPSLTPAQIESTIKSKARSLPGSCSGGCGSGLADAGAALGSGGTTTTGSNVFRNTTDVSIPDTGSWATSSVTVTGRSGNAPSSLKVDVDIKHTYRGDLIIEIVAPDGSSARLKDSSDDSTANLLTTYTVNASDVAANGTWKLRVADVYSGDTGYIDSWGLTF